MEMAKRIFRMLYGAWFLFWGASGLTMRLFGVGVETPKSEGEAQAFMDTVNTSFMGPIASVFFVIAGSMLMCHRAAPMGIATLTPFVTYILFFHATMTRDVVWGVAWFAGWALLAWWYRAAFAPLLNYKG